MFALAEVIFSLFVLEEVTVLVVSLLVPVEVTFSLFASVEVAFSLFVPGEVTVSVVSLLVPEQAREVEVRAP